MYMIIEIILQKTLYNMWIECFFFNKITRITVYTELLWIFFNKKKFQRSYIQNARALHSLYFRTHVNNTDKNICAKVGWFQWPIVLKNKRLIYFRNICTKRIFLPLWADYVLSRSFPVWIMPTPPLQRSHTPFENTIIFKWSYKKQVLV